MVLAIVPITVVQALKCFATVEMQRILRCNTALSCGFQLRSFAGNTVPGETRGYRPLHDLQSSTLSRELVEDELWNRLATADKLVTQCPMYGGMWLVPIVEEVRRMLSEVEDLAVLRVPSALEDVSEAAKLIRRKTRQVEYDYELDAVEE